MDRQQYLSEYPEHQGLRKQVASDKNRLRFHLMGPSGWVNDPNGLCQFQGVNHIYFQHTPFLATWGTKLWGHYATKDWIHYQGGEPFLFPDQPFDRDGAYSGSAFVEDGRIHYFYTGNVKYTDKDYDYILKGREQNTVAFTSPDGWEHGPKSCLLTNRDYPADMTLHVRDPKVFKKDGKYYMMLGARSRRNAGCVLLYESGDLQRWTYRNTITTPEPFGYMWECPDLFELDGQLLLMACPQGVPQRGDDFANVYQCGVFPIQYDFQHHTYELGGFQELDHGFDIYAPQTFEDEGGRRILIGWMGIPDAPYHNGPTVEKGWQHALTLPRELHWRDGRLIQTPLKELKQLQGTPISCSLEDLPGTGPWEHGYQMAISLLRDREFGLALMDDACIRYQDHRLTLSFGESGCGRTSRSARIERLEELSVWVDRSSIEIFANGGEAVFTSRVYNRDTSSRIRCVSRNSDFRGQLAGQSAGTAHGRCSDHSGMAAVSIRPMGAYEISG